MSGPLVLGGSPPMIVPGGTSGEVLTLDSVGNVTPQPAAGGAWPGTTLGDTSYGASGGTQTRLAGNTTAVRKFLRQLGTGSVSAAPAWDTLHPSDIPANLGLQPSGDTTGATDTASIQGLLNLGAAAVVLAQGVFHTNADLLPPPAAVLVGSGGFDPLVDGDQGTVIKPVAGFTGAAVITVNDVGHAVTLGPALRDFSIDGSAAVATIDGIRAVGPVVAGSMQNVFISSMTGVGWNGLTDASATGQTFPYGWHNSHVKINTTGAQGVVCSNHTDGTWIDVHTINTTGQGFSIAGAVPNSRFIGCKAEWAGTGKDGFHLTGAWGTGTGSGGVVFAGCSTDRNDANGMGITATGTVPVLISGCSFRRDGRNGGTGGGGFAGLNVAGATVPIVVNGVSVWPGVDDTGSGTNSPQYGASVTNATSVALSGGYLQGNTAAIHNGGGNTLFYTGPDVLQATGTTSSPSAVATTPVSGQFLCTPSSYAPGSQTSLTATTTTMAAFSSANVNTGSFTAPPSGSVIVEASFVAEMSAAAKFAIGLAAHGTVTPLVANEVGLAESSVTIARPYVVKFLVTGLTPGTSYNFDLVGCAASSDTLTILAFGQTSTSPGLSAATTGAPVIMTVQAV
jgi:hypothetical protein